MAEYIEREKVYTAVKINRSCNIYSEYEDGYNDGINKAMSIIKDAPASDARPERHGKWKRSCDRYSYFCSECGEEPDKSGKLLSAFCPWCGAKMDGKDGESDG